MNNATFLIPASQSNLAASGLQATLFTVQMVALVAAAIVAYYDADTLARTKTSMPQSPAKRLETWVQSRTTEGRVESTRSNHKVLVTHPPTPNYAPSSPSAQRQELRHRTEIVHSVVSMHGTRFKSSHGRWHGEGRAATRARRGKADRSEPG